MADKTEAEAGELKIREQWATEHLRQVAEARKQKSQLLKTADTDENRIQKIQKILRTTNAVSAASLIGLIITFLIMNFQLIFGNGLKFRYVPKLAFWEILLLVLVDAAVLLLLFFLVVFLAAIAYVAMCLGGFYVTVKCIWASL